MSDLISLEAVNEWNEKLINELELIFSDIREKNVDDSVCGLCEYDCDHGMDGFANECPGFEKDDCFKLKDSIKEEWTEIKNAPAVPAIPIPDGATNGDVIKRVLYGKAIITEFIHETISVNNNVIGYFDRDWWNAPYKGGQNE